MSFINDRYIIMTQLIGPNNAKEKGVNADAGYQLTIQHCLQPYVEMLNDVLGRLKAFQKGWHPMLYDRYEIDLARIIDRCQNDPIIILATAASDKFAANLQRISTQHFGLLLIAENLLKLIRYSRFSDSLYSDENYSQIKQEKELWEVLRDELEQCFIPYFHDYTESSAFQLSYSAIIKILLRLQNILLVIKNAHSQEELKKAKGELQELASDLIATKTRRDNDKLLRTLVAEMDKQISLANDKYENGNAKAAIAIYEAVIAKLDQAKVPLNDRGYNLLMESYAQEMWCHAVLGDEKAVAECYKAASSRKISASVHVFNSALDDKEPFRSYWSGPIKLAYTQYLQRQASNNSLTAEEKQKILKEAQALSEEALEIIQNYLDPRIMRPLAYYTVALLKEESDPDAYPRYLATARELLNLSFTPYAILEQYGKMTQRQVYQLFADINYRLVPFAVNIAGALELILQAIECLDRLPNSDNKTQMQKQLKKEKTILENQIKSEEEAKKAQDAAAREKEQKEQKEKKEEEKREKASAAAETKRDKEVSQGQVTTAEAGSINSPKAT